MPSGSVLLPFARQSVKVPTYWRLLAGPRASADYSVLSKRMESPHGPRPDC